MELVIAIILGFLGAGFGNILPKPSVTPSPTPPPTPLEKNAWAFLVAGSNGWYNYRHQADVCHSYHVMIAEGIPPERIIVMMYDDIAYNEENPTPGVIINKPNGTNVYAGVKIDYKENDVTPSNFLNILKGNSSALEGIGTGRVIESNEDTNIFLYFADHGGAGSLSFPNDDLLADDFENTLREMHQKQKYNKFITYIEACESGSMFDNILEENTNVYAMTAAARDESSFGWYCDSNCLGDEFSVKWMEHMDSEKKGTLESFFHQFQHIRSAVIKSHVNIYGDFSLGPNALTPNKDDALSSNGLQMIEEQVASVNSRDVALHYLKRKLSQSNDLKIYSKTKKELDDLIQGRKKIDELFEELVTVATREVPHLRNAVSQNRLLLNKGMFPCYKNLLSNFKSHCFGHQHEYIIQHYYKLANICVLQLDTTRLIRDMPSICDPYKIAVKSTIV